MIELDDALAEIDPHGLVERDVRQPEPRVAENGRVVADRGQHEYLLMLEVLHALGGEPVRDDARVLREGIISKGVVAVIVGVD